MASIHVIRVTQGWPEMIEGLAELCTVDVTVDGLYVRVGYHTTDLTDAAALKVKLEADSVALLDPEKQSATKFPFPTGGTDRPDLVPADFII